MKANLIALGFVASASCFVARTDSCCFEITASGGPGGLLGQLSDGQNRIGQGLPPAKYCISNGGLTDTHGRGCILTPPTTQWQCDEGASPTAGFSINCEGGLMHNGNGKFYSCPTGDHGGYNIYTALIPNEPGCVEVHLHVSSCYEGCPKSTPVSHPPPPPATTPAKSTVAPPPPPPCPSSLVPPPAPPKPMGCPPVLQGAWEFPHLIIPLDSAAPSKAYGTSLNGTLSKTMCSAFNFDIPLSTAGKLCSLVFLFPKQSELETSSFTFSGQGGIDFSMLAAPIASGQSYSNMPPTYANYGVTNIAPGNSYVIHSFACPAEQSVSYLMSAVGDTALNYFQDFNPSPIGLYITVC